MSSYGYLMNFQHDENSKSYYMSNDGEELCTLDEINFENILQTLEGKFLWTEFDQEKAITYFEEMNDLIPEDFKEYSLNIIKIDTNCKIIERYYDKYIIIFSIDKDGEEVFYQLENDCESVLEMTFVDDNDDGYFKNIQSEDSKFLFYDKGKRLNKYNRYDIINNALNALEKYLKNNNIPEENLAEMLVIRENANTTFVSNKLENLVGTINKNYFKRYTFGDYIYTLRFKNTLKRVSQYIDRRKKDFDSYCTVSPDKTSDILKIIDLIDIWAQEVHDEVVPFGFENEKIKLFINKLIYGLDDREAFNKYRAYNGAVNALVVFFNMDNLYNRLITKPAFKKLFDSVTNNGNIYKYFNKLIRLYYKKIKSIEELERSCWEDYIIDHLGRLYITLFIVRIIKPEIANGVDVKKKYGLTPNNFTLILNDIF